MRILVVEDEPKLNKGIVKGLKNRGYAVDFAYEGQAGQTLAEQNPYDAIILDIMMPRRDGLTVCRNLRTKGNTTPILFLTAKDSVDEKVTGLNEGADDYLVKPFAFDELDARLRSLLRRPQTYQPEIVTIDDLTIDPIAHQVKLKDKEIEFTTREFSLLTYLARHLGQLVTRQQIIEHVWDTFYDARSNVIDVHLKNIRKKLPTTYAERIQTIRGQGYRFQ